MTSPVRAKGDLTRDILAIVGSVTFVCGTGLTIARCLIVDELSGHRPDLVVSGGADGIDKLAVAVADELGVPYVELIARDRQWDGPRGFRARNIKVSKVCTRAMRISCARTRTYGSGWTVDRVETVLHRPVRRIVINVDGTVDDTGWTTPPAQEVLPI